jgi:hypothetical protein
MLSALEDHYAGLNASEQFEPTRGFRNRPSRPRLRGHVPHTKPPCEPVGRRQGAFFQHPCAAAGAPRPCSRRWPHSDAQWRPIFYSFPRRRCYAWHGVDRPASRHVGLHSRFHVLFSAAWMCSHAQATCDRSNSPTSFAHRSGRLRGYVDDSSCRLKQVCASASRR